MLISPSFSFPLLLINKYIGKIKRNKDIFFLLKHLKNLFLIYDCLNVELLLIKKTKLNLNIFSLIINLKK
jgi:hypothetical protein